MHAGMHSLYAEETAAVEEGDKPALRPIEPKVHDPCKGLLFSPLHTWSAAKAHHALLATAVQACGAGFHLLCVKLSNARLLTCKGFNGN